MTTERRDPPRVADERMMLEAWLEYHRATLAMNGQSIQRRITLQIGRLQESIVVTDAGRSDIAPAQSRAPRDNPPCSSSPAAGNARIGGNLRAPVKIRDVKPQYPERFQGTGADAVVVLDGRIGLDGFIKDIQVREPADPEFANALATAVREWEFDSTLLNCVPVEVSVTVTCRFLHDQ